MRRLTSLVLAGSSVLLASYFAACSNNNGGNTGGSGTGGATSSNTSTSTSTSTSTTTSSTSASSTGGKSDGGIAHPCSLPGSIQFTDNGTVVVPGVTNPVDLSFLHLPKGFCAHYFAKVGNARQIRQAPGGEMFVASPTGLTTGGGQGGLNAIVVLPDDDKDGVADAPVTFMGNLMQTQGLLFANGSFYYQDNTKIMKVAYNTGDRTPSAAPVKVADITYYNSSLHWPKPMDIADDGSIYVGNGGDQGETCSGTPHAFHGGIRKLDSSLDGEPIAQGFRNPIAVRCVRGKGTCFALELAKDYTAGAAGREKMVPIHKGDDWGFPCCASKNQPYTDIPATDCSTVVGENVGFYIGDTPFGLAFAPDTWPKPYAGSAFVANHGAAGSWVGARVVAIGMDPATGMPLPGGNINGQNTGSMTDFATGWDDSTLTHGRPAALEVSDDGRLFVANDNNGVIFWIAPID